MTHAISRSLGAILAVAALTVLAVAGMAPRATAAQDAAGTPAFYTERVAPVFQKSCASCHGGMNHRGGFNMATKAGMLKGGKDGVVLLPGDPSRSVLVRLMRHEGPADDPMNMPPAPRPKVSDAEIDVVAQWIKAGAVMPADAPKP